MVKAGDPVIVKTTGERELFDEKKLRSSLRRSGARKGEISHVVAAVRERLEDGMTTRKLYRIAFATLRSERRPAAARYSLQKAITQLGPSGFPFEQFIAELLREEGWKVRTGATLKGQFVRHEVDFDARRRGERLLGECKFRNQKDAKIDIKIALYVYARSLDLNGVSGGYREFWLVTNGRFTSNALQYGEGMGLKMLSWDKPLGASLKDRIDRAGLHPITCLTGLRISEKREMLRSGTILVRQICRRAKLLTPLGLSLRRKNNIIKEAAELVDG